MKNNLKKIIIVILLVPLLIVVALSIAGSGKKSHPTDNELIANFKQNKADFVTLLTMFQEDKQLGRVGDNFTRPADVSKINISEERIDEYHKFFQKLNLKDGIEGYDEKDIIWFHTSGIGLSISGSSKGYVYSRDPSSRGKIVDNLDDKYRPENGQSFIAFKPIEGNWYLYFDYEN